MSRFHEKSPFAVTATDTFYASLRAAGTIEISRVAFVEKIIRITTDNAELRFQQSAKVHKNIPEHFHPVLTAKQIATVEGMFVREPQILDWLNKQKNPYIPRLLSVKDGKLVMERVSGVPAAKYIWESFAELWVTIEQLILAVYRTYQDRVINYDLAGRNILIDINRPTNTRVKLIDFGMGLWHLNDALTVPRDLIAMKSALTLEVLQFLLSENLEFQGSAWNYVAFTLGEVIAELSCRASQSTAISLPGEMRMSVEYHDPQSFLRMFKSFVHSQGIAHSVKDAVLIEQQAYLLSNLLKQLLATEAELRPDIDRLLGYIHMAQTISPKRLQGSTLKPPSNQLGEHLSMYAGGTTLISSEVLEKIEQKLARN